MQQRIIGVMGAMPEEISGVVKLLNNVQQSLYAGRVYHQGSINNIKTVVVISGWGKVAAAATVSTLIHKFNITELVFTGVAGAIDPSLNIGDIVLAKRLLQHDMDARPFIPRYEIPLLGKTFFDCDPLQLSAAVSAAGKLLDANNLPHLIVKDELHAFNIGEPKLHIGDIASGDQFFSDNGKKKELLTNIPTVLCVEMEGAAVAQVCFENEIPFTVIRTISDAAGDDAHIDFAAFIQKIAGRYSAAVVKNIFNLL